MSVVSKFENYGFSVLEMNVLKVFCVVFGKLWVKSCFSCAIHLNLQVDENEMRELFARYGSVKEVKIITYRGGICKGWVPPCVQSELYRIFTFLKLVFSVSW